MNLVTTCILFIYIAAILTVYFQYLTEIRTAIVCEWALCTLGLPAATCKCNECNNNKYYATYSPKTGPDIETPCALRRKWYPPPQLTGECYSFPTLSKTKVILVHFIPQKPPLINRILFLNAWSLSYLLLLLLHSFNGLFSRTVWVSWYQNGKISLDLIK